MSLTADDIDKPLYRLAIDGVDGETSYYLQTRDQREALEYLMMFDHEGASLLLMVGPNLLLDNHQICVALGFYDSEHN